MSARNVSLSALYIVISLVASTEAIAGRYDGLVDIFNRAAKNIDPPPPPKPKELDFVNRPQGFDPPGMHGPTVSNPTPPTPVTPPSSLTNTFNSTAGN